MLTHADISLDVASTLYIDVERAATRFDDVIVEMKAALEDDDTLVGMAETLEQLWSLLCLVAANKVRELQGLPAIDPYVSDDGV